MATYNITISFPGAKLCHLNYGTEWDLSVEESITLVVQVLRRARGDSYSVYKVGCKGEGEESL
jgi:hypothetical protein